MNPIVVNHGECLHLDLQYANDDDTVIDVTGISFEVIEASQPALLAAYCEIINPEIGYVLLSFTESVIAAMFYGPVNWIRVAMIYTNGCRETSPKIFFDLQ